MAIHAFDIDFYIKWDAKMREGIFVINPFNHCRFSGGALVLISRRPMIQNAAPNRMRRGVEDNVLAKLRRRNCTFDDVQQTVLNFGGKLLTAIFNKLRVGFKAYDAKALFEIVFGICLAFIIIFGLYNIITNKKGSWSKNIILEEKKNNYI